MTQPVPRAADGANSTLTYRDAPVKLIASDIDGTVLCHGEAGRKGLSVRTIEAFTAARAAGAAVVLITGRPLNNLGTIRDVLGEMGPVICSNGALTYDLAADAPVRIDSLDIAVISAVKETLSQLDPNIGFAASTLHNLHMETEFIEGTRIFGEAHRNAYTPRDDQMHLVGALEETLGAELSGVQRGQDGILKMLALSGNHTPDSFLSQAREHAGHLVNFTHSSPQVAMLEISAHGISKASALQHFAESLNIAQEHTVAFGDMPNDVEMLGWAGTSWAMEDGHHAARAAADHTAPECGADGVAQVIEQLMEGRL